VGLKESIGSVSIDLVFTLYPINGVALGGNRRISCKPINTGVSEAYACRFPIDAACGAVIRKGGRLSHNGAMRFAY